MNFKLRKIISGACALVLIISLASCTHTKNGETGTSSSEATAVTSDPYAPPTPPYGDMGGDPAVNTGEGQTASTGSAIDVIPSDEMFTDRDGRSEYDASNAVTVKLADGGSNATSASVKISGSTVTISAAGTYIISGSLSDGQIKVDAGDQDKIQLVLNGVDITSKSSAAIYVKSADKVFITLEKGSENTLSCVGEYIAIDENSIDAVIFAKDDISFNGEGALTINAKYGHGIVSKDDLVMTGGTYIISAEKHALCGKDSVRISGGAFDLTAGKDGIHSENTDDEEKGYIYISGGDFTIKSESDGIDAEYYLRIFSGSFDITAGAKGVKATGDLLIAGGDFILATNDDAVHSNANADISSGDFTISTGDDAFHADENISISGGEIDIQKSYEGIEGATVNISGGNIYIASSDDGINAAGGTDSSGMGGIFGKDNFGFGGFSGGGFGGGGMSGGSSDYYINISDGTIKIKASGDGIDANGSLFVSGGEIYVSGSQSSGNGALDYDGTASITGGTLIAVGSSGMAQNFGSSSTQGSIMVIFSQYTTGTVTLKDSSGNVIASFAPESTYNNVVVSSPSLVLGGTYTVTAGTQSQEVTLSSLIYGSSGMGGGMGGIGGGIRPGGKGGFGG